MFYLDEDILLNMNENEFKMKTLNFENLETLFDQKIIVEEINDFIYKNKNILILLDIRMFY